MRTKTGEKIAEYMSPFDVVSSRDAVLNTRLVGTRSIEMGGAGQGHAGNNKLAGSYIH
jgi:hypothetical protein